MVGKYCIDREVESQEITNDARQENKPKVYEYNHPPGKNPETVEPLRYQRDFKHSLYFKILDLFCRQTVLFVCNDQPLPTLLLFGDQFLYPQNAASNEQDFHT